MKTIKTRKERGCAILLHVMAACSILTAASCAGIEPEGFMEDQEEVYDEYEKVRVSFRTYVSGTSQDEGEGAVTRVSETAAGNIIISVYNDGLLVGTLDLQDSRDGQMELNAGKYYNYYATANIQRDRIPEEETVLKSSRINVSPGEPSEGIPMAAYGGFTVTGDGVIINIMLERLYSKIRFSVDSEELPGLKITGVRIRQAATSVSPFAESAATSVSNGDTASGTDIGTLNGGGDIILYLPENCQGELLPSNGNSWEKVPDNIPGKSGICSYIEVTGELDGTENLYGEVLYRFYLGQDATSDFNVIRNTENAVTLRPSRDAIATPSWLVEPDVYADVPLFVLDNQNCVWFSEYGITTQYFLDRGMTYWEKAIRGGNMYLAIGHTDLTGGNGLAGVSSDGKTWEVTDLGYRLEDVEYGNGIFLGMTDDGQGYFSYDGKYWNPTTLPSRDITDIEFGNGKFLAIQNSGFVYYSNDGRNWKNTASFIPINYTSLMEYGDGKFFIMNNNREAAVSSDGISWKKGTCSFDGSYLEFQDIIYGNGIFLLSTYDNVYMSEDGFAWKKTDISSSWENFLLDYKDGVFAATFKIQGAGQYFGTATSLNGISWTFTDDIRTLTGTDICIL